MSVKELYQYCKELCVEDYTIVDGWGLSVGLVDVRVDRDKKRIVVEGLG